MALILSPEARAELGASASRRRCEETTCDTRHGLARGPNAGAVRVLTCVVVCLSAPRRAVDVARQRVAVDVAAHRRPTGRSSCLGGVPPPAGRGPWGSRVRNRVRVPSVSAGAPTGRHGTGMYQRMARRSWREAAAARRPVGLGSRRSPRRYFQTSSAFQPRLATHATQAQDDPPTKMRERCGHSTCVRPEPCALSRSMGRPTDRSRPG